MRSIRRAALSFVLICGCAAQFATAQTLAYWRFEEGKPGEAAAAKQPIRDASGHGNDIQTFHADTAPSYSSAVAFQTVPQTGEPNRVAMDNTSSPANGVPTRDFFTVPADDNANIHSYPMAQWTIEASVLLKPVANWQRGWQTFVGRDGYNIPDRPAISEDRLANLGFKKRGDNNCFSIEAWDSSGQYVAVQSGQQVQVDVWYHLAAVSDGRKLVLYIKGPDDKDYVVRGEAPFNGALANGGDMWSVGRGCFAYNPAEQFFGLIDEVRISAAALKPEEFLASPNPTKRAPATLPAVAQSSASKPATQPMPASLIHPHDPAIVQAGEWYHVFASHEGIGQWRSRDLINWERLPSIFTKPPEWATREIAAEPGLWAPDCAFFNGKYHLYYSVSRFGSQRSAIGLVVNESLDPADPKHGWKEMGIVVESRRGMAFNTIDPCVAFDAQGQPWLVWGSFHGGIYMSKLDPTTGKLPPGEPTYHHLSARPGDTAIEAAHVFYNNGWYYQVVAYDFCCRARSTYKLMVGRSKEITGPYVDRQGQPMLEGKCSLLLRSHDTHRGPGHTSLVTKDGRQFLTHHYYDARQDGIPTLAVRPLYWDDDAWPLLGEPIAETDATGPSPTLDGNWHVNEDYGAPIDLVFHPDGRAERASAAGRWNLEGTRLVITWPAVDSKPIVDRCHVSNDRNSLIGRRSDGTIIRAIRVTTRADERRSS